MSLKAPRRSVRGELTLRVREKPVSGNPRPRRERRRPLSPPWLQARGASGAGSVAGLGSVATAGRTRLGHKTRRPGKDSPPCPLQVLVLEGKPFCRTLPSSRRHPRRPADIGPLVQTHTQASRGEDGPRASRGGAGARSMPLGTPAAPEWEPSPSLRPRGRFPQTQMHETTPVY